MTPTEHKAYYDEIHSRPTVEVIGFYQEREAELLGRLGITKADFDREWADRHAPMTERELLAGLRFKAAPAPSGPSPQATRPYRAR